MGAAPIYFAARRASNNVVNTANTNTDGTGGGSFPTIVTAGQNGSLVESVVVKGIVAAAATQAADTVRLWHYDGANKRLIKEVAIAAGGGVISATVQNTEQVIALNFPLKNGEQLLASTHVGGATASYHVTANVGDY
jgi:hypothetical protein